VSANSVGLEQVRRCWRKRDAREQMIIMRKWGKWSLQLPQQQPEKNPKWRTS